MFLSQLHEPNLRWSNGVAQARILLPAILPPPVRAPLVGALANLASRPFP